MIFQEPLEAVVRRRYSVRTYSKKPITRQAGERGNSVIYRVAVQPVPHEVVVYAD